VRPRDIARVMRQQKVKPKQRERKERPPRDKPGVRLADAFQDVPPGEESNPQSVYRIPDSWPAPPVVQKKALPKANGESATTPEPVRPGPKRKPKHKSRKFSMSLSMSEEEEFYLRKFASDKGMKFSEWARAILFEAMKRDIPSRR